MMYNKTQTIELITEPSKLRNRALYWLSKRDYSISDFQAKLDRVCEIEELKTALIDDFIKRDWINEERYMESFVRAKLSAGLGQYRIKQELVQHGIRSTVAESYLASLQEDWFEQAKQTYIRKYGAKPAVTNNFQDQKERAKRYRYMQYRGFSPDQINYAMTSETSDEF